MILHKQLPVPLQHASSFAHETATVGKVARRNTAGYQVKALSFMGKILGVAGLKTDVPHPPASDLRFGFP